VESLLQPFIICCIRRTKFYIFLTKYFKYKKSIIYFEVTQKRTRSVKPYMYFEVHMIDTDGALYSMRQGRPEGLTHRLNIELKNHLGTRRNKWRQACVPKGQLGR